MRPLPYCTVFVFCLLSCFATGQKSDLYLFDISQIDGKYELSRPRLLSGFNPNGYTNQPSFIDPYRLLVTAGAVDDPINTDIYELNLRQERITRLTRTPNREYSASISRFDPKQITCVLVEVENNNRQRLWTYPIQLEHNGKGILTTAGQVGYYCELDKPWIAVFEVGTPNKLFIYNTETGARKFISSNIGRSLHKLTDNSLVFVHKISDSHWFLKKVNTKDFIPNVIKKTIPEAEDFTVLKDDSIIMGAGSKIYRLDTVNDQIWREMADLSEFGIKEITRLAHNGLNMLALVEKK